MARISRYGFGFQVRRCMTMKRKYNYGRSVACWVCCVYVLGSGCVFESLGNGFGAALEAVASCSVEILVEEALGVQDSAGGASCMRN